MAEPPFSWLLAEHRLICPTCGDTGTLEDADTALLCSACHASVPVTSGVPDFFTHYTADDHVLLDDAPLDHPLDADEPTSVVDDIASVLDLPDEPEVRETISTALRMANRDTNSPALTAEIREVHTRFVGGDTIDQPLPDRANGNARAHIERHYAPSALVAGQRRFINLRLRNVGDEAWSSRTNPTAITAGSRFHRRSFGRRSVTEPVYTPLPIDIEPGRAITLPVEVEAPLKPGGHELELGLFLHPQGFVDGSTVRIDVDVHDHAHPDTRPIPAQVQQRDGIADYGEDHRVANEIVNAALDKQWPDTDRAIVEIGGSTHPQSWNHERTRLVNVDISAPTLQLGALFDRYHDRSIVHLCADAMQTPLAPGSWHAVVMYATLHHFPEPERLLEAAARLLLPGGFVAVMCEPTDTTLAHPAGIRDLLGGINEQTFAVDEYLWMAEQAGLVLDEAFNDLGSLKAVFLKR